MTPLVLATYLIQAAGSAVTAIILLRLWLVHRRDELRLWAFSWAALAVFQAAAGLAIHLSTIIADPTNPIRLANASIALTALGWHLVWIVLGTLVITREYRARRTAVRQLLLVIVLAAAGFVILTATTDAEWRRLARLGASSCAASVAFAFVAVMVLTHRSTARSLGAQILAFAAMLYALAQASQVAVMAFDRAAQATSPFTEYAGLALLLLQVIMALGMLIWLLEDERSRSGSAAAALAESQSRLRRIIDDVHMIAWEFDPRTSQFTYVSPQAERILGFSLDEWRVPGFWFDHVHPEDRDRARAYSHEQSLRGVGHEYEYRMLRKDGGVVWLRDLTSVVRRGAEVESLHGVLFDITERKRAETALRDSEARYRAVVEDQTELICRFTPDGALTFANDAYCRYFQITRDQLPTLSIYTIMNDDDAQRLRETLARLRPDSPAESFEIRSVMPDGQERWRQWTDRAIFDADGRVREMQAVGRDVTRERLAQEALAHSNDLQKLLLSELDHRVRNNLASLTALIDISARDSGSVRDFASAIRSRVQAMAVVHALLSREHWRSVDLRQLVLTLAPTGAPPGALRLAGEDVAIVPRQATALGMVVQELLANSQKYGALSASGGRVAVEWTSDRATSNGELPLRLVWRECGGPPIESRIAPGVGTGLIQGLVRSELRGEVSLSYPRDGALHTLTLLLERAT